MSDSDHNSTPPINSYQRKDSNYSSDDKKTRPSGTPAAKKDFKKMLQKVDDPEIEEAESNSVDGFSTEAEADAAEEIETQKKSPPSLFDLSSSNSASNTKPLSPFAMMMGTTKVGSNEKGDLDDAIAMGQSSKTVSKKGNAGLDTVDAGERAAAESPADAYARLTSKKGFSKDEFDTGSSFNSQAQGKEKIARFDAELTDLSAVNPMALTAQQITADNVKASKAALPANNIQDIVNQLVEKASQMELDGKTETTVTLKQPPILAGANLVVTSFDSARGEFNISFQNLTQQAKNLLDQNANQESLRLALEQKGYAVHIVTTTTLVENRPIDTPQSGSGRGQDDDDKQDGRGGNKRQR